MSEFYPLNVYCHCFAWCFYETADCKSVSDTFVSSWDCFPSPGTIFLLLGCVIMHGYKGLCLVLLYLVMMFVDIPRRPALSEGKQRNSGSGPVGMLETREFR